MRLDDLEWHELLSLATWLALESGMVDELREQLQASPRRRARLRAERIAAWRAERLANAAGLGATIVEG